MLGNEEKFCIRHNDSHVWLILGKSDAQDYIRRITGNDFELVGDVTFLSSTYDLRVLKMGEGDEYNEYENEIHRKLNKRGG